MYTQGEHAEKRATCQPPGLNREPSCADASVLTTVPLYQLVYKRVKCNDNSGGLQIFLITLNKCNNAKFEQNVNEACWVITA